MPRSDWHWWTFRCACGWHTGWVGPMREAAMLVKAAEVTHKGPGHQVSLTSGK
jgi:hypothetical protein